MSAVKEMVLFSAGLVITVALIFMSYNVYTKAAEFGQGILKIEDRKIQMLKQYEIEKYEGKEISGNLIISYVREMYQNEEMSIVIATSGKSFEVDDRAIAGLREPGSGTYINPLKSYLVELTRDKNDAVSEIRITEINH